jgi:hypothetical protein
MDYHGLLSHENGHQSSSIHEQGFMKWGWSSIHEQGMNRDLNSHWQSLLVGYGGMTRTHGCHGCHVA